MNHYEKLYSRHADILPQKTYFYTFFYLTDFAFITTTITQELKKEERISLHGITNDSKVTEKDIEEVKSIWK
ncbi:MAG: hypothetical protein HYV59_11940 [Planctomycetes bacterium]|nr:hypothetical protein [Planctomycetota bacterium]